MGASDGFDGNLDAWKLFNYGGNPNIYSFHAGDKLAINAVDLSAPKVLQLGIEAPQTCSMYELSLEQIVHGNPYEVLLEDKYLNTFMDITNAPYSFQYGGWSNSTPRFNLHINTNTCIKCDSLNIGDFFLVDGDSIEVVDRTRLLAIVAAQGDLTKVCVSHVTDMKNILRGATWFNQDISRWDVSNVTNMNSMFFKNRKFNQDISAWDVSSVTNMLGMFSRCDSFNQNLNTWDVSAVTNMNRMFKEAVSFNGAIAQWNVENVTRMTEMFSSATAFNQDLSDWCVRAFQYQPPVNFALNSALVADHYPRWGNCPQDFDNVTSLATGAFMNSAGCVDCSALNIGDYFELGGDTLLVVDRAMLDSLVLLHDDLSKVCVSNITDMKDALRGLRWFNTDIAYWDVSNVTDMSNMFFKAQIFNQDIGNWDVSNVTKMVSMFQVAKVFNQDIGSWDVIGVQRFRAMFRNALAFNQDIGGWDVSSVLNDVQMSSMFRGCASFNQDLSMWCVTNAATKPSGFDANSALVAANLPLWGTCPTPGSRIGNDQPIASDEANGDEASPTEMQEIALFPNPTTGMVQIDPVPEGSYKILDAMGKTLEQGTAKEYYNFSEQPNGVYTLMLQTRNTTHYIKVVKK
ncbi:BspA family leucine-rich repeat surface protein [Schleiferiaceae bacterium]|nr:BspA family leucine-rich repeat surface protein [Schleiferiaceae bacterium]